MHYVKHFNINGVDTKQVTCIELHGKPNAATEGAVGVLGIDVDSPSRDVYKCVDVNGSIYTWQLFSSGMSIMNALISGHGTGSVRFPYGSLRTPVGYVVKVGDLIIDAEGHLYQVVSIDSHSCIATYCGIDIIPTKGVDYYTDAEKAELIDEIEEEIIGDIDTTLDNIIAIQKVLIGDAITFTINDKEYLAKSGMTWGEWCVSTYNTAGLYCDSVDNTIHSINGDYVGFAADSALVYGSDVIVDGESYVGDL